MLGTPYFTAPEVLKGKYTCVVDEWAVGVIMYRLYAGKYPFNGNTVQDIYKSIEFGPVNFERVC